ncbi:lysine transporter LysE [Bacillus sp. FJAT-27225]|uniref:LysE family translocator n=1 Tax=Bacillus sp. FJAT-27225 TaxID=1743144 RepID=UPI00080C34BE|nr:LysE family transporter [Bacillus sp. FJAT-27225]OCA83123.1 lysine transporter LysE [Bacillus sp. FJAT-27225]
MLLLKSILLGFSVSAPIGPIGLLCIQRTLDRGIAAGISTGLGAVTANVIYASIAALGISAVSTFLLDQQTHLRIVGAAFLVYLGMKTFWKKPAGQAANLSGGSLWRMYASTFLLMITNPVTILNFTAMFAGLGIEGSGGSQGTALTLVAGVAIGAAAWWIFLSVMANVFRTQITPHLGLVNKLAGLVIVILGVVSLISLVDI